MDDPTPRTPDPATEAFLEQIRSRPQKQPPADELMRATARDMRTYDVEKFRPGQSGDGDRFAAENVDLFRYDETNKNNPIWYSVDDVGRWSVANTGEVTRACRKIVDTIELRMQELAEGIARLDNDDASEDDKVAVKKLKGILAGLVKAADRIGQLRGGEAAAIVGARTYGMCIRAEEVFDQDRYVLACKDQLVQLGRDGAITVRSLRRDDYITRDTGTAYNPRWEHETPPMMQNYLDTFIADPAKERALFKFFGAALVGTNPGRKLGIILGGSTSGKGQLTDKAASSLGDYAVITAPTIFKGTTGDAPRPDLLRVMKARLAFMSEASKNWRLHVDRVKDMTGQSEIAARGMRSNDFTSLVPEMTPVLVTNEMPRIEGADAALLRRLLVIPFDRSLSKEHEDTSVRDRFNADQDVSEWLLYRMVQGYSRSVAEGMRDVEEMFASSTAAAMRDISSLTEAVESMCELGYIEIVGDADELQNASKSGWVQAKVMWGIYAAWVKEQPDRASRESALAMKEFNAQLRGTLDWSMVTSGGARWYGVRVGPAKTSEQWARELEL